MGFFDALGLLDGPACALGGLVRIALQAQCICQGDGSQNVVVVAEIGPAALLRARTMSERRFQLGVGASEVADEVERIPEEEMGQRDRCRIAHDAGRRRAAPGVLQRHREIAVARVEDVERNQLPHLIDDVVAFLGDGEASVQRGTCRVAAALGEHQRKAQCRLKPHFFGRSAPVIVKSENCPLRPAMTFGQHRRCQQNRRGGDGKPDAEADIVAIAGERPVERAAQIVDVPDVMGQVVKGYAWAFGSRREYVAEELRVPAGNQLGVTILGQFLERIDADGLEQSPAA